MMMQTEVVVLSRSDLERIVKQAVADAIDQVRPLLLKAATEYATDEEVEARFGLPRHQLSMWRKHGEGPAYVQLDARKPLYKISDVDAFLSDHRVDPTVF